MSDDVFRGITMAVVVFLVITILVFVTFLFRTASIADQCRTYGKFFSNSGIEYQCKLATP